MLMHPRFPLLAVCLAALLPCRVFAVTWTETRSPHFRVITDGSEKQGRHLAAEFEQMRHVFTLQFNREEIGSPAPLTIFAARDFGSVHVALPAWKDEHIAGRFVHGWEREFAVVRLDTFGDENQIVVFHEYTHSVLHANTHWLPAWLDEGLAEFYSYTQFESARTLVGVSSVRLDTLHSNTLIPIPEMLTVNPQVAYRKNDQQMQVFYAEAWAMVHYMQFSPDMDRGKKLHDLMGLLERQVPEQQAFQQVFGDPRVFEEHMRQYVTKYALPAAVLPPDTRIDEKSFIVRTLTPAESDAEIAFLRDGFQEAKAARLIIEESLKLDPKLASAHEELGFLLFRDGEDDAARSEWQQAVALDANLPRARFALLMTAKPFAEQSPQELLATQAALRGVTMLAPRFAPAFVEIALIEWRRGYLEPALSDAKLAQQLEPSRAGYALLIAHILLRMHQPALAAKTARYVAEHWTGADHNEAVNLFNEVPATSRGDDSAPKFDFPPNTTVLRGTLTSLTCAKTQADKTTIVLTPNTPDAKPATFTTAANLSLGFSDTFWWGEDHFSVCHHLTGSPAVVAVTQTANGRAAEVVDLESRDDLPAEAAAAASSQPGSGTSPTASGLPQHP